MRLDETDRALIRVLQDDSPVVARPFRWAAQRTGLDEETVLDRVRQLMQRGVIRRFGAFLRHRQAGVAGNIMVAWQVPSERAAKVGRALAAFPEVTHCYERPPFPGFPYNLYTMVHAESPAVCTEAVARMARAVGVERYEALPTRRELKRTSPRYFT